MVRERFGAIPLMVDANAAYSLVTTPEEYARNFEDEISANIDALKKKIGDAAATAARATAST